MDVRSVVTREVIPVPSDATPKDAIRLMESKGISGLPVVDDAALMLARHINRLPVVEAGRLVGIITRADVAQALLRSDTTRADDA